ncbi:hypothetical protein VAWG004_04730 [Aeromonas veronii]|nr:hypothetical protein VAWG004_04730 [Aeromonas veronii]
MAPRRHRPPYQYPAGIKPVGHLDQVGDVQSQALTTNPIAGCKDGNPNEKEQCPQESLRLPLARG